MLGLIGRYVLRVGHTSATSASTNADAYGATSSASAVVALEGEGTLWSYARATRYYPALT